MAGLKKRETKIYNQSGETISLIPFSRPNGADLQSEFSVRKQLAKNILEGKSELVKPKDYDSSHTGTGSQIYMLFRRGEFPETVKPRPGEKVFLYTQLGEKPEWRLSLDKNRQVSGGPGYGAAGQTSSGANPAGTQDAQLGELKKEVQKLKEKVEDLLKGMADLEKLLHNVKLI